MKVQVEISDEAAVIHIQELWIANFIHSRSYVPNNWENCKKLAKELIVEMVEMPELFK